MWAIGRNNRLRRSSFLPRRGYTLLEICIVLFILALLIGAVAPNLGGWLSEEKLRAPSRRLELLARTARLDAIDRQHPYEVVVRPDSLALESAVPDEAGEKELPEPYALPDSISILTKGWGGARFSARPEVRWRFQPNGLCEPFSAKFVQGGSEIALSFNPLTAATSEETYEFR